MGPSVGACFSAGLIVSATVQHQFLYDAIENEETGAAVLAQLDVA